MENPEKHNNQTSIPWYPQLTDIPDYSHKFVGLGEEMDAYKFAMEDKNYPYANQIIARIFSRIADLVLITSRLQLKESLNDKDYQESKYQPTQREVQASIRRKYAE